MINQGPRNELAEKVTELRARIADLRSRLARDQESNQSTQTQPEQLVDQEQSQKVGNLDEVRKGTDPAAQARAAKAAELDALKAKLMGKKK